jgi:phosphatidylserine/phosphatidylglycerophosphate/cardiolipin synthase-like enzyme
MLEAQQLFEQAKPETTPIATLPETSEALRSVLGGAADECFQTRDGFHHVTARAQHRIIFLIPFMDATGAVAVSEMLQQCSATERIIITRPDSKGTRYHLKFLSQFEAVGAQVLEYWKDRSGADGPRSETFHAKLVLADRDLIYVGSSNLMASSLDGGLECGVLLEGGCARPFRRIVEAVLQVSQRISV